MNAIYKCPKCLKIKTAQMEYPCKHHDDYIAVPWDNETLQAIVEMINDSECYCGDNPTHICPLHRL